MKPRLATRRRLVRNVDDGLTMGECMAGRSRGGNLYVVTQKCRACAAVAHRKARLLPGAGWEREETTPFHRVRLFAVLASVKD